MFEGVIIEVYLIQSVLQKADASLTSQLYWRRIRIQNNSSHKQISFKHISLSILSECLEGDWLFLDQVQVAYTNAKEEIIMNAFILPCVLLNI